ncbi:hypothetical protein T439DRAFT_383192 [Meredithblackwellia eburnea MCA 4105]
MVAILNNALGVKRQRLNLFKRDNDLPRSIPQAHSPEPQLERRVLNPKLSVIGDSSSDTSVAAFSASAFAPVKLVSDPISSTIASESNVVIVTVTSVVVVTPTVTSFVEISEPTITSTVESISTVTASPIVVTSSVPSSVLATITQSSNSSPIITTTPLSGGAANTPNATLSAPTFFPTVSGSGVPGNSSSSANVTSSAPYFPSGSAISTALPSSVISSFLSASASASASSAPALASSQASAIASASAGASGGVGGGVFGGSSSMTVKIVSTAEVPSSSTIESESSSSTAVVQSSAVASSQAASSAVATSTVTDAIFNPSSVVPTKIVSIASVAESSSSSIIVVLPSTTSTSSTAAPTTTSERIFNSSGGQTALVSTTSSSIPAESQLSSAASYAAQLSASVASARAAASSGATGSTEALSPASSLASAASAAAALSVSAQSALSAAAASSERIFGTQSGQTALVSTGVTDDSPTPAASSTHLSGSGSATKSSTSGKSTATTEIGGGGSSASDLFGSIGKSPVSITLTTIISLAILAVLIGIAAFFVRRCHRRRKRLSAGQMMLGSDDGGSPRSEWAGDEDAREKGHNPFEDDTESDVDVLPAAIWARRTSKPPVFGGVIAPTPVAGPSGVLRPLPPSRTGSNSFRDVPIPEEEETEKDAAEKERKELEMDKANLMSPKTFLSPNTQRVPSSDWTSFVGDQVWESDDDRSSLDIQAPATIRGAGPMAAYTRQQPHPLRTSYVPPSTVGSPSQYSDPTSPKDRGVLSPSAATRVGNLIGDVGDEDASSPFRNPYRSPGSAERGINSPPRDSWRMSLDRVMGAAAELVMGKGQDRISEDDEDRFTSFSSPRRAAPPPPIVIRPPADPRDIPANFTPLSSTYSAQFAFNAPTPPSSARPDVPEFQVDTIAPSDEEERPELTRTLTFGEQHAGLQRSLSNATSIASGGHLQLPYSNPSGSRSRTSLSTAASHRLSADSSNWGSVEDNSGSEMAGPSSGSRPRRLSFLQEGGNESDSDVSDVSWRVAAPSSRHPSMADVRLHPSADRLMPDPPLPPVNPLFSPNQPFNAQRMPESALTRAATMAAMSDDWVSDDDTSVYQSDQGGNASPNRTVTPGTVRQQDRAGSPNTVASMPSFQNLQRALSGSRAKAQVLNRADTFGSRSESGTIDDDETEYPDDGTEIGSDESGTRTQQRAARREEEEARIRALVGERRRRSEGEALLR